MRWLILVGGLALAIAGTGCASIVCGPDTVEKDGVCVPASLTKCGGGTSLVGSECKPICKTGTIAGTAGCVISDASCGVGTELVEDSCRTIDLFAKVTEFESAEPNDTPETGKRFSLPAIGANPVQVGGVVNAATPGEADFDAFVFSATALSRVRISAVAVGVPSVGVVLVPASNPGFMRYVVSLDSRNATRELTLPIGGDWLVKVTEATNLDQGSRPRSAPGFSYAVGVSQLPAAIVKALPAGKSQGSFGDGDVFELVGGSAISLVELKLGDLAGVPFPGVRQLWAIDADGRFVLNQTDVLAGANVTRMPNPQVPVPPGGLRIGVDFVVAAGPITGYELEHSAIEIEEATPPFPFNATGDLAGDGIQIFGFDAEANTIVEAEFDDVDTDLSPTWELRDNSFKLVASDTGYFPDVLAGFVTPATAGRWFVVVKDPSVVPSDDTEFAITISGREVQVLDPLALPGSATVTVAVGSSPTFFAIYADKDGVVDITATSEPGNDLDFNVFNTGLREMASDSYDDVMTFSRLPIAAGSAIILGIEGDSAGDVELAFTARELVYVRETEPNNSRTAPQSVVLDAAGSVSVTGEYATVGDHDWFRFEITGGPADLVIETFAGARGGSPDTEIALVDEAGVEIDSDDDGASTEYFSKLTASSLDPGVYFVHSYVAVASGYNVADSDYSMEIRITQ